MLAHLIGILLCFGSTCGWAKEPLREVLFGSCLKTTEHPMLDRALTFPRDLFIFLGDNIYADTTNMTVMRLKYNGLKGSRFFEEVSQGPVLATWDDHDFGMNDGGADYPMRHEAQKEFLDWLGVPEDSPRRKQQGVYHAETFGPAGKRVQVILLDTRYFRSPLKRGIHDAEPSGGPYVPNSDPSTTLLGDGQWRWLEEQLREPAELRLIVSSIQFVPEFAGSEAWANLPHEKERLLKLIRSTGAEGIVFLSGDRHWCELSKMDGPLGYPLYELTASAMTQVHPRGTPTPNRYRLLPKTYHRPNVGRLRIDWEQPGIKLALQILDVEGTVQLEHQFTLHELRRLSGR